MAGQPSFSACCVRFLDVDENPPRNSWGKWWLGWILRTFLERKVELTESLHYTRPDNSVTTIPKGTQSDGPSFPVLLAWLLPSRLRVMESGIYHDYLGRILNEPMAWADGEFRQALRSQGMGYSMALICYLGLRVAALFRLR